MDDLGKIRATVSQFLTLRRTFVLVVFAGIFAFCTRAATDPDLWWHLSTGKLIVHSGGVPHTDPFSYSCAGQPWVAHEWLSEVFIYGVYRLARWSGLIVAFATATLGGFLFLYLRCPGKPYLAAALTLFGLFACSPVLGVRPQMLSFLLVSVLLWILERSEANRKSLWWIPFIFVLWVNLHGAYAAGVLILMIFTLAAFAHSWRAHDSWRLFIVLLITLIGIAVNPNGLRMYSYPFEVIHSASMQNYIAEWFSPDFHKLAYAPFMILILALVVAFALSPQKPSTRDLVLLLGTLWAALASVRHIPLFVLISIPVLARCLRALNWPGEKWADTHDRRNISLVRSSFHATFVLIAVLFASAQVTKVCNTQKAGQDRLYPSGAVAFLKSHTLPPNVFGYYDWGGYLIWSLYPEQRVYIDGRADVYGDSIFRQFSDTYQLRHDWRRGLLGACTVVVPTSSALAAGLRVDNNWFTSYADEKAAVFQARYSESDRRCAPVSTIRSGNFTPAPSPKDARI